MYEKHYAEICHHIDDKSYVKWYIPHHEVDTLKKSLSERVVFYCVVVFHSKSLNACFIQGPDLLNLLIVVLCQFAQMCDITKMFYRFKV